MHREDVDQSRYPWSAIGKVTNETGGSCSGVMIATNKVLTAAHCLYNYRGRRFVGAEAVHFLLGYRAGRYTAHARVARYEIGPGFDPQRYDETYSTDWAVLTLAEALPSDIVPLKLSADAAPNARGLFAGSRPGADRGPRLRIARTHRPGPPHAAHLPQRPRRFRRADPGRLRRGRGENRRHPDRDAAQQ
jgi:hypothetical protein